MMAEEREFVIRDWLAEGARGLRSYLPETFTEHMRTACREILLANRALLDAALERLEERPKKKAMTWPNAVFHMQTRLKRFTPTFTRKRWIIWTVLKKQTTMYVPCAAIHAKVNRLISVLFAGVHQKHF